MSKGDKSIPASKLLNRSIMCLKTACKKIKFSILLQEREKKLRGTFCPSLTRHCFRADTNSSWDLHSEWGEISFLIEVHERKFPNLRYVTQEFHRCGEWGAKLQGLCFLTICKGRKTGRIAGLTSIRWHAKSSTVADRDPFTQQIVRDCARGAALYCFY